MAQDGGCLTGGQLGDAGIYRRVYDLVGSVRGGASVWSSKHGEYLIC